ncbi:hypothetical protein SAMN05428988_3246 [Chitinophaga sp. YR573]|uniref:hypothetical protein n=1 Tax=Chitinophaga sp. YR573 TaxID=1881040 RepID=UPI0008C1108C|nr:hypothetical protein [Chitinophaga sp. YR573]SEW21759.1 hypothetical protein SAMN05428988_3246 [Chitinophaga sp. YR573]
MRNILRLADLPDMIRYGIMTCKPVPQMGLSIISKGNWKEIEGRQTEEKADIFYYTGVFWKHVKHRTRAENSWPDILDEEELMEVFPNTISTVVYN